MATTVLLSAQAPSPWMAGHPSLELPEELDHSLNESPTARDAFSAWSLLQQWDVAWFIELSPDGETRRRRAERARSVLEGRLALLGS